MGCGCALLWLSAAWAQVGLPVASVSYDVRVTGPIAEMTVEQVFVNDTEDFIEATYVFPLHEQAAVDGMEIRVQDRVVRGQIMERGEAEDTYEEAVAEGFVAALTTQSRPNVFAQRVGNLPPGEQIRVSLRVVQPVPRIEGSYELTLPLVVAPRFVRDVSAEEAEPGPIVAYGGTDLRASIDVLLNPPAPLTSLGSPTHRFTWTPDPSPSLRTRVPLDRDVVLRWTLAGDEPQVGLVVQDDHLLLTFEPPAQPDRKQIVPRELVWVVDRSCSMAGTPMALVKRAMVRALQGIDRRDRMRILEFSSHVGGDERSWKPTRERVAEARSQILGLGTAGGTYLLDGVLEALASRPSRRRARYVIFLTDGLIGEERDVLGTIRDRVGASRLFTFGVGAAPNRYLLDEMARFGGGRTTWLRANESPEAAVDRFMASIGQPVLEEVTIDWGDWVVSDLTPRRIPALLVGQPLYLAGRVLRRGTSKVVVHGRVGDGKFKQVLTPVRARSGRGIRSTWARQTIGELERDQIWEDRPEIEARIRELSLRHQVLSRYTAFLAVDASRVVHRGIPERRVQGVEPVLEGTALQREFLERIPAGRSYQNAVLMASGVQEIQRSPLRRFTFVPGAPIYGGDPMAGAFSPQTHPEALETVGYVRSGTHSPVRRHGDQSGAGAGGGHQQPDPARRRWGNGRPQRAHRVAGGGAPGGPGGA